MPAAGSGTTRLVTPAPGVRSKRGARTSSGRWPLRK